MKNKLITILGIETSCDETAASVLRGDLAGGIPKFAIISNVVKTQIPIHAKMGGVVPEVAARAHLQNILPVVQKALTDAGATFNNIDYIAPTTGPGLIASLIVGTEFAKSLAFATNIPILPINHMEGHLYSSFGEKFSVSRLIFPAIALIVSGGHTMLVHMKNESRYKVIGSTADDAAGEAFDKIAKMLKLPYPGGPIISKLAEKGLATIQFPRPMMHAKNYDFSFSGLKTAVLYYIKGQKKIKKEDVAKSFEEAVVDVLTTKTMRAAKEYKAKTIMLSGGVSANRRLREILHAKCRMLKINFLTPTPKLRTDNAAMIAIAAYFKLRARQKPTPYQKIKADSSWEI